MTRRQHLLIGLCLVLVVVMAYAPVRHAGFVYDDRSWILQATKPPHLSLSRPIMHASWWWQARVTPAPMAFHAVNLGLHLANVAIFGWLLGRLGLTPIAAWVAAAVFALHPLAVESVAYLSGGRPELLAASGVLLASALALGRSSWRWIGVGLALVWAVAGKETGVVGLALVPLLLAWRRRVSPWLPAKAVVVLTAVVGMMAVRRDLNPPDPGAWLSWIGLQATAVHRLLVLAVVPIGQTVDYDYDLIPVAWRVVSALALIAIAAGVWRARRAYPLAALGVAWIGIVVLPRFILQTNRSYFNEHQFYLALPALALVLVSVMTRTP